MTALPESLIERWPILPVAFGKPAEITAALSPPYSQYRICGVNCKAGGCTVSALP